MTCLYTFRHRQLCSVLPVHLKVPYEAELDNPLLGFFAYTGNEDRIQFQRRRSSVQHHWQSPERS